MPNVVDALRRYVSGIGDLSELAAAGLAVDVGVDTVEVEQSGFEVFSPTPPEVASGLMAHLNRGSACLYARTVLATGAVDLAALNGNRDGEALLEALWDIAGGGVITRRQRRLISRLARP